MEREWLVNKLRRIPRLEAEVMRPQNDFQRRISRMFWELEGKDCEWLKGIIGDLADRTDVPNKAAWFNTAATTYLRSLQANEPEP